jgi:hypothetical protein
MYTSDVIGAKQNTYICHFFPARARFLNFPGAALLKFLFYAQVLRLGALGCLHME